MSCRASADATVTSETPAAIASHHVSRRATREKALPSIGSSAVDAALPSRHTLVPSQHRYKAGTQAAPVAAVQPAHPQSAKRSLLSRQAPHSGVQVQQEQLAASPSSAVMDLQPPSQGLAVVPEAAEECTAQGVPQDLQQDNAEIHMSAKHALHAAGPADAFSAPASTGYQAAAAAHQQTSVERVECLDVLASPVLSPHEQLRSLGECPSKTEHQQRESYFGHHAVAPAAGQNGVSAAATPVSLLQLAAAPAAQQQSPSHGLASTHHQSAGQSAKHHHQSAAQPAAVLEGCAAVDARQDASSSGADVLQGLQASLLQTVTSAVESAMTQMRCVFTQGVSIRMQKFLRMWLISVAASQSSVGCCHEHVLDECDIVCTCFHPSDSLTDRCLLALLPQIEQLPSHLLHATLA